jgi:hypothetical protein
MRGRGDLNSFLSWFEARMKIDKISEKRIDTYSSNSGKRRTDMLQRRLDHDLQISYINGSDRISKRFANKPFCSF